VALTLEILRLAVAADEKVLLFTGSLEGSRPAIGHEKRVSANAALLTLGVRCSVRAVLTVLEEVLKLVPSPRTPGERGWQRGLDYVRFDGSVDADERDTMLQHFAEPALKLRLFLISTRAGGQGLNLAAASRVIVFDASWNPATDTQAVYRAYRYGQTRPVHVYRLIAEGFEQCLYRQQVVKLQLAGRVLDEQSHEAQFTHSELRDLWHDIKPSLPPPASTHASVVGSLPSASWVQQLVDGSTGEWLKSIEDHDKRLEGEEEVLDAFEMEVPDDDRTSPPLAQPPPLTGRAPRPFLVSGRTRRTTCARTRTNCRVSPRRAGCAAARSRKSRGRSS
jgi:hypothetical protein